MALRLSIGAAALVVVVILVIVFASGSDAPHERAAVTPVVPTKPRLTGRDQSVAQVRAALGTFSSAVTNDDATTLRRVLADDFRRLERSGRKGPCLRQGRLAAIASYAQMSKTITGYDVRQVFNADIAITDGGRRARVPTAFVRITPVNPVGGSPYFVHVLRFDFVAGAAAGTWKITAITQLENGTQACSDAAT